MGCGSCSTGAGSTGGCGQKGGCKTGGCNKLNTYDWFDSMQQPTQSEYNNVYEIRFKNTRKEFFRNANGLSLITGDFVAVESDRGFDVGQISLGGILAQLQMRKKKVRGGLDKVKKIYRRATKDDLDKLQLSRSREQETLVRSREIVRILDLDMKMSEVEYQADNTKAIFYYISDQRVDFRELLKLLANEFRIRIEMKQIGLRFESAIVGGIGSCGRELCCSTWLSDFKTVSTAAARYQNLSLNPMKISGQCGRLKCCLNFELDSYLDALKDIPKVDRIETDMGMAFLQKTDIFKRTMWFSYAGDSSWIPMEADKVIEMAAMNKQGIKPASLHVLDKIIAEEDREADFVDVVGQSVPREDPKRKKKKKKPLGSGSQPISGANSNRQREEGAEKFVAQPEGEPGDQTERPKNQGRPQGQEQRGPRSQVQNPENRNQKQQRPASEKQQGQEQRGPRPQNQEQNRGPRPQGQEQNRGPKNQDQNRGPRPERQDQNRGPRPQNQEKNASPGPEGQEQNRGPKPQGQEQNRGPRPQQKQGGPRPEQQRPPRNQGAPKVEQPPREPKPRPEQKPRNPEGQQNPNTSGRDFRKIEKKQPTDRPPRDGGGNPPSES